MGKPQNGKAETDGRCGVDNQGGVDNRLPVGRMVSSMVVFIRVLFKLGMISH